jgi:ribosomal protein L32
MDQGVRTCRKCGEGRPVEAFYDQLNARRAAKGHSPVTHCRYCQSEYMKGKLSGRRAIVDAAKAVGCADCGHVDLDHPEVFDFDHVGDDKTAEVAKFVTKGTVEDLRAEIAKCEVVCSNCHRIRTRARVTVTFGQTRKRA